MDRDRYFPLFVPSKGKQVVVVGGGAIAERRVQTLLQFDFSITVIAPHLTKTLQQLSEQSKFRYLPESYQKTQLEEAFLVLACTNDRTVNHCIGEDAKALGKHVSVADCRDECNVYFPAVIISEELTVGLAGDGNDHHKTKRAADWLRRHWKERTE